MEVDQRWTVSNMSTSIQAARMGYGFAWFPEDRIRDELAAGTLKPLPLREGGERFGELYLIFADRDAAGPATLRLAEIIREGRGKRMPQSSAAVTQRRRRSPRARRARCHLEVSRVRRRRERVARRVRLWFARLRVLLASSAHAWSEHRADSKGAALAFYTLFSMTPILVMAIAVAGYFFGEKAAQGEIIDEIQDLVGPNAARAIQALVLAARNPASGLTATVIAGAVFILGATTVFVELKSSLDELWRIETRAQAAKVRSALRATVHTRLVAFGIVLVLALLFLASLIASAALAMIEHRAAGLWGGAIVAQATASSLATVSSLISLGVIAVLFAVIYKMLPDLALPWRDVWIGAAFTAVLFAIGKFAIGLYIGSSGVATSSAPPARSSR